jgi:hypothetical protein
LLSVAVLADLVRARLTHRALSTGGPNTSTRWSVYDDVAVRRYRRGRPDDLVSAVHLGLENEHLPRIRPADGELQQAIAELRQLARGLYPVVLMDQGLAAALTALAKSRHLRLESVPSERLPAVVESTAYLLVARVSEIGRTTLGAASEDGLLVVDATVEGDVTDLGDTADRVRTLEGSLDITHPRRDMTLVQLRLSVDRAADQDISENAPAPGG